VSIHLGGSFHYVFTQFDYNIYLNILKIGSILSNIYIKKKSKTDLILT
jgi:hypothetical protein